MAEARVNIPIDTIMKEVGQFGEEVVEAVAKELLAEIKKNAQSAYTDRTGNLSKSIKKKKDKFTKGSVIVGAFAPHAHLIEFGHNIKVAKGGDVIGHVEARPFVRPAEDAIKSRIPQIVQALSGITIEVKK